MRFCIHSGACVEVSLLVVVIFGQKCLKMGYIKRSSPLFGLLLNTMVKRSRKQQVVLQNALRRT